MQQVAGRARDRGVIVLDERSGGQDESLLASAQSHLDGSVDQPFPRLVAVPLVVPSEWYHGVQAADTVCRAVANVTRYRRLDEMKYSNGDAVLGPLIDELTAQIGNWDSLYVR